MLKEAFEQPSPESLPDPRDVLFREKKSDSNPLSFLSVSDGKKQVDPQKQQDAQRKAQALRPLN